MFTVAVHFYFLLKIFCLKKNKKIKTELNLFFTISKLISTVLQFYEIFNASLPDNIFSITNVTISR